MSLQTLSQSHRMELIEVLGQPDCTDEQLDACNRICDGIGTEADKVLFLSSARDMVDGIRASVRMRHGLSAYDHKRIYSSSKTQDIRYLEQQAKRINAAIVSID